MSVRTAVLAVLRAVVDPVFDGDATGATEARYAVLYVNPGQSRAEDVANTHDLLAYRFQVTSVGGTPEQCEWVADRTQAALAGTVLTVPGLVCGPIDPFEPELVRRDDERPDRKVFYTTCTYQFAASHA